MKNVSIFTKRILLVTATLVAVSQPLQATMMGDFSAKLSEMRQKAKNWTEKQLIEKLNKAYKDFQEKMKSFQKSLKSGTVKTKDSARKALVISIIAPIILSYIVWQGSKQATLKVDLKIAIWRISRNLKTLTTQLSEYITRLEASTLRPNYATVLADLKERYRKAKELWKEYKTKKFPIKSLMFEHWMKELEAQGIKPGRIELWMYQWGGEMGKRQIGHLRQIFAQLRIAPIVAKDTRLKNILKYDASLENKIINMRVPTLEEEGWFSTYYTSKKFGTGQ